MFTYNFRFRGSRFGFEGEDAESIAQSVYAFYKVNDPQNLRTLSSYTSEISQKMREKRFIIPAFISKTKDILLGKKVTLGEAWHGAAAMIRLVIGDYVPQEEINRRSEICNNCPKKSKVSTCMTCGGGRLVANQLSKLRAKGRVPDSVASHFCGVCDCALAPMVLSKPENFLKETNAKTSERPDDCWVKQILRDKQ